METTTTVAEEKIVKPGKLYVCPYFHLLAYELEPKLFEHRSGYYPKQCPVSSIGDETDNPAVLAGTSEYWATKYGMRAWAVVRGTPLLLLKVKLGMLYEFSPSTGDHHHDIWQVVAGEQTGWIIAKSWLNIKPI